MSFEAFYGMVLSGLRRDQGAEKSSWRECTDKYHMASCGHSGFLPCMDISSVFFLKLYKQGKDLADKTAPVAFLCHHLHYTYELCDKEPFIAGIWHQYGSSGGKNTVVFI